MYNDDTELHNNDDESLPTSVTLSKIKQLENIASGEAVATDVNSLRSRLATFMVAHANKVIDTVAPLEQMREELTNEFITKSQEMLEDPEANVGTIARAISCIQDMNAYSMDVVKSVLEADKANKTLIAIDASNTSVSNSSINVHNLNDPTSRAKVTKAITALQHLMNDKDILEVGNDESDSENNTI